jgi:hypothetical protein
MCRSWQGSRRVDAYLYDLAWKTVRAKRKHAPLEDELLWHKVYEEYIGSLPKAGGELIERHLRIVPAIAGRIAWKRCPGANGSQSGGQRRRARSALALVLLSTGGSVSDRHILIDKPFPREGTRQLERNLSAAEWRSKVSTFPRMPGGTRVSDPSY